MYISIENIYIIAGVVSGILIFLGLVYNYKGLPFVSFALVGTTALLIGIVDIVPEVKSIIYGLGSMIGGSVFGALFFGLLKLINKYYENNNSKLS